MNLFKSYTKYSDFITLRINETHEFQENYRYLFILDEFSKNGLSKMLAAKIDTNTFETIQ